MSTDERTREDLLRQLDKLAHWAKECSTLLLVQWTYRKGVEIRDRDKQVMTRIRELVKDIEAHQPPPPPPTEEQMAETRKMLVGALDQRENRLTIEELEAALFLAVADANRCDDEQRTEDDYRASAAECIASGAPREAWIS